MNYSLESKNLLAKLMATENINIVHQKIPTAMFDPKSRTLYCPIWKDMSNELRDLLLGHETGHALETPPDGWHDAVTERGRNYKAFLNVVEDSRIEKKIKRRYPGLKRSFIQGYQELLDRDFFGIQDKDVNTLPFIDRLNLYTKGGVTLGITFNADETTLLNEVTACETWDDVVRVTEKVYGYSKQEQYEMQPLTVQVVMPNDVSDDDYEFDDQSDDFDQTETDGSGTEQKSKETGNSETGASSANETDDVADDSQQNQSNDVENAEEIKDDDQAAPGSDEQGEKEKVSTSINRFKETKNHAGAPADFDPICETDNAFRDNEKSLVVTNRHAMDYTYSNMPKPIMKNILVPHKKVQETLSKFYSKYDILDSYGTYYSKLITDSVKEFETKNDRYVSLLAKEFEMRKAASKFAKAKVSNTGDLDINKIYKYRVDENVFKKIMRVPKGKSHGLILLLDYSGSMQNNMSSSIEQILVLAMFCRKVNIPFVVYSFGNSDHSRAEEFEYGARSFQRASGNLVLSDLSLREYMNSTMSNMEFKTAMKNMICLSKSFAGTRIGRPNVESLSNTPLIEAIIALQSLTIEFRKKNNLDIVNLAIIHDGDADNVGSVVDNNGFERHVYSNLVVTDPKTKFQVTINRELDNHNLSEEMRSGFFDWYRQTTGTKIFGFFLVSGKSQAKNTLPYRYYDQKGLNILGKNVITRQDYWDLKNSDVVKNKVNEIFTTKCLVSYSPGYNAFYFVPGGSDLQIDDGDFEIDGKVTVNKLKNAFVKYNKKRQLNRVLATKFIEGMAVA
jgi:cobalamin biosynthesis protein CobT